MKLVFAIIGSLCSLPCTAGPLGKISNVVVSGDGLGPRNDGCETFQVDAPLVQSFFESAVVVTGRQQHDYFLFGPCYAKGTLESPYGHWRWELRNLGTGSLESLTGDFIIFANPEQESPLSDDGEGPNKKLQPTADATAE